MEDKQTIKSAINKAFENYIFIMRKWVVRFSGQESYHKESH
jgi:hypothetical protein